MSRLRYAVDDWRSHHGIKPCSSDQITLCYGLVLISMSPPWLARRFATWDNSGDEVMEGLG